MDQDFTHGANLPFADIFQQFSHFINQIATEKVAEDLSELVTLRSQSNQINTGIFLETLPFKITKFWEH